MSLFIKNFIDREFQSDFAFKKGDHILVEKPAKDVVFGNIGILAVIGATVYVGTKVVKKNKKNHENNY